MDISNIKDFYQWYMTVQPLTLLTFDIRVMRRLVTKLHQNCKSM